MRVTAPSMFGFNVDSIPIDTNKSNKYRYANNVKVMRCIWLRFERCEKTFCMVISYDQLNKIAMLLGHLVTRKDDALLVS